MKKTLLSILVVFLTFGITQAQTPTTQFSDDFEGGDANWVFDGNGSWQLSTFYSHSPSHSLSDGPIGNYGPDVESYATMAAGVDLTGPDVKSAYVKFWANYQIEGGNFDYCWVEVSDDDFDTYVTVATFMGESTWGTWNEYDYAIGSFVGKTNVKVRFHFYSDGGYEVEGIYIDDFEVYSTDVDEVPPLILHTPPQHYQGAFNDMTLYADIIDVSGVHPPELTYWVDGAGETTITGTNTLDNEWEWTIPQQTAGAWVKYIIVAVDSTTAQYTSETDTGRYIAGNYIAYDNGVVDFIMNIGTGGTATVDRVANKITIGETTDLVTGLIRNYTDPNRPNDNIDVYVWDDNAGMPGTELHSVTNVVPEANLTYTSQMTRLDFRGVAALEGLTPGDYYIGYGCPGGEAWLNYTNVSNNRAFEFDGTNWTSAAKSFHIRAITSTFEDLIGPAVSFVNPPLNYQGGSGDMTITAKITDPSGIDETTLQLNYKIDGIAQTPITDYTNNGDYYSFIIPEQEAGALVAFSIEVSDLMTPTANATTTDEFEYIQGKYWAYDNGVVDYFGFIGTVLGPTSVGTKGAVLITPEYTDTLNSYTELATILIRNYDASCQDDPGGNPYPANDDIDVYVWESDGATPPMPGNVIAGPITVTPAGDCVNGEHRGWTIVDMRGEDLDSLTDNFFVGYEVNGGDAGTVYKEITIHPSGSHSRVHDGTAWDPTTALDLHFRAITTWEESNIAINDVTENEIAVNLYPNPSTGLVNIELSGSVNDGVNIEVYDILGNLVKAEYLSSVHRTAIDLSAQESGLYFIQIRTSNKVITKKLMLN